MVLKRGDNEQPRWRCQELGATKSDSFCRKLPSVIPAVNSHTTYWEGSIGTALLSWGKTKMSLRFYWIAWSIKQLRKDFALLMCPIKYLFSHTPEICKAYLSHQNTSYCCPLLYKTFKICKLTSFSRWHRNCIRQYIWHFLPLSRSLSRSLRWTLSVFTLSNMTSIFDCQFWRSARHCFDNTRKHLGKTLKKGFRCRLPFNGDL